MSELVLKELIDTPSTYRKIDFRQSAEYTVTDEIDDRVGYLESMVRMYQNLAESYPTDDMREQLAKYEAQLEEVKGLYALYAADPDKVTFREYILEYDASNEYGVPIRSKFQTRFNTAGEIVGTKLGDKSWIPVGNFFSIPEYYEILEKYK